MIVGKGRILQSALNVINWVMIARNAGIIIRTKLIGNRMGIITKTELIGNRMEIIIKRKILGIKHQRFNKESHANGAGELVIKLRIVSLSANSTSGRETRRGPAAEIRLGTPK